MCGIAGILNLDGAPVEVARLKAMTDARAHRGPDGEGWIAQGAAGLGHRRLAVIDLWPRANQPLPNEDETVFITYNGEIDNFQPLRSELERAGHRLRSRTDAEVVLAVRIESIGIGTP